MTKQEKYSEVCSLCFKEPTPFPLENKKTGYWMVVPKNGDPDPTVLMSSGELKWRIGISVKHPIDGEYDFLCDNCFKNLLEDYGTEEEE